MAHYPKCRVLAIIGSGETSPTMVTVHRDLLSRLRLRHPQALLLATPYAFQENAVSVSARAQRYFADSVGLAVRIVPGTSRDADPVMASPMIGEEPGHEGSEDREATDIRAADWVFAGPGSPSYALAHWQAGPAAAALRERVLAGGGLTVLASAAAATAGQFTLPVYEIYKAGGAPHWLPGLDLFGTLGLKVAVIPHYDNAEGGRYDTRYCYLGARRLAVMERELPADAAVLGVDEHTAVLFDLRAGSIKIRGRGALAVRRTTDSTILPSGTSMSIADLRSLVLGAKPARHRARTRPAEGCGGAGEHAEGRGAGERGESGGAGGGRASGGNAQSRRGGGGATDAVPLPLPEVMAAAERGFAAAAGDRDADTMVGVILELDTAIKHWEADTDEDQGTEQARALLRSLVGRLGQAAQDGLADPSDRLRPAIEPLLALRNTLRGEGNFAAADAIREALAAAGFDVSDTPTGPHWQAAETV
jgi:hypothetical protein